MEATSATEASAVLAAGGETSAAVIAAAATSEAAEATSSPLGELLAARHLPLHDLADEADHAFITRDAHMAALVGGGPLLQVPLRHELVELRAADRDVDARIRGRILGDLRTGQLDTPDRDIAALRAQLEADHELEVLQRRYFGREVFDCLGDQRARVLGTH